MLKLTVFTLGMAVAAVATAKEPSDENMTGKKEMFMTLCPSAAPGARTEMTPTSDGVELVVSAKDEPTRVEIRKRARRQEEIAAQPERGTIEHTGLGTGSGRYGHCPGMLEGTDVQTVDTSDGVRMVITARDAGDVKRLQRTTRERIDALKARHRGLKKEGK